MQSSTGKERLGGGRGSKETENIYGKGSIMEGRMRGSRCRIVTIHQRQPKGVGCMSDSKMDWIGQRSARLQYSG